MKRLALVLMLLSAPAMAQDAHIDTVTVNGISPIGIWRIETPRTAVMGKKTVWHPYRTRYCRVTAVSGDLAADCLNGGSGSAEMNGNKIHFAWGSMLAREVIDATFVSALRFDGSSAIKLSGVAFGSDDITTGTKVTLQPDMPDPAGKAGLVMKMLVQLQGGALLEPHIVAMPLPRAETVRALGAIKTVTYLGEADQGLDGHRLPLVLNAYEVAYTDGELLCGLHQREDGVLDAFRCV